MARIQLNTLAENISGKLNKRSITVLRKKKYRSESGKVIAEASQEAYDILNPRDYKKNPPKGTELRNITSFAEASRLTTALIRAGKYTDDELAEMTDTEREEVLTLRSQLAQFKARFNAQLTTPDSQAPLLTPKDPGFNPNSTKPQHRKYRVLNTYIRVMLQQAIKSA